LPRNVRVGHSFLILVPTLFHPLQILYLIKGGTFW
jgi:hypothetical protein